MKQSKYEDVLAMSNREKIDEMLSDLQKTLDNNDLEDALTLICMIKNAAYLDKWLQN